MTMRTGRPDDPVILKKTMPISSDQLLKASVSSGKKELISSLQYTENYSTPLGVSSYWKQPTKVSHVALIDSLFVFMFGDCIPLKQLHIYAYGMTAQKNKDQIY